jgi:hypothetical protein
MVNEYTQRMEVLSEVILLFEILAACGASITPNERATSSMLMCTPKADVLLVATA